MIKNNKFSNSYNFGPFINSNKTVKDLVEECLKHWNGKYENANNIDKPHEAGMLNLVIEKVSFNKNSEQDFLQEMNNYIEKKIREYPHEYLWQHRRFKSTLGKDKLYK